MLETFDQEQLKELFDKNVQNDQTIDFNETDNKTKS